MSSGVLRCTDGVVTVAADGAPLCSGYWSLVPVPEPFGPDALAAAELLPMFTYGFSLVGVCCVLGIVGRLLLNSIYNPNKE
jgi:hypothetical protein